MTRIVLHGCAPKPLAHYLKALGLLRLVAEQIDPDATGCWEGDHFVLETEELDADGLTGFLLERYRPTPIVAPWNGGSGFYFRERKLNERDPETGKKIKTGIRDEPTEATRTLNELLKSTASRFGDYREVLGTAKQIVAALDLDEAPKNEPKDHLIGQLRSNMPEISLKSLDSMLVLTSEKTQYPSLWGTGGTDGNLDFTNNFMQRLVALFDPSTGAPTGEAVAWLPGALQGEPTPGLTGGAIGQFAPGDVGGPNATTGFEAGSIINPWDFVLMLEGGLLFAAAATRRLESRDPAALSFPFTVRPTRAGAGSGSGVEEGTTRAEMWLPLWDRPATHAELRGLLAEGRVTLGRRPVRDGLDFARSVARLGVDRGIRAFQRYAFVQRSGRAFLAAPMDCFPVPRQASATVELLADLDRHGFLERLRGQARRDEAPGRLQSLVRGLEEAIYGLARLPDVRADFHRLQDILALLGDLQSYLARSPKLQQAIPRLPELREGWVVAADDGSAEYRLAVALASLWLPGADGGSREGSWGRSLAMRAFIAPLAGDRQHGWTWSEDEQTAVWGGGALIPNLLAVLDRRILEWRARDRTGSPFQGRCSADGGAVGAFLAGDTDDDRIARLLPGLTMTRSPSSLPDRGVDAVGLPGAFGVLKPFFTPERLLKRWWIPADDARLPDPAPLVARLSAGGPQSLDSGLDMAWQMAHAAKLRRPSLPRRPPDARLEPRRVAAALLVPLDATALNEALGRVYSRVESEAETAS